ncbi:unnamed protein product [Ixodes hexagonus]
MYPAHSPTVAILGDSQVKYLHTKFDSSCRQFPTMFVSLSGGCISDFHQEVDLLPPSVRIVLLHIATNDLASHDPQPVLQRYIDLLHHLQTRPGIQLVICTHILPRIINRHLRLPNRQFTDAFNHRADNFNQQLTNICMTTPGLFVGVDIMGANLRALFPCLLRRIPRQRGTPAPDLNWPTLEEAARMEHTRRRLPRRDQPRRNLSRRTPPSHDQRPN